MSDHWKSPCGVDLDSAIVRICEKSTGNIPDILNNAETEFDRLQKIGQGLLPKLIGGEALWDRLTDGLVSIYEDIDIHRNIPIIQLYIHSYMSDIRRYVRQRKRDVLHIIGKFI